MKGQTGSVDTMTRRVDPDLRSLATVSYPFFYLPEYSPEFHLIEILWRLMKY